MEPANMTNAYFRPTIYPSPSNAAPVLHVSTSFVFSITVWPQEDAVDVIVSAHQPNVATI